ncbi:MAG: HTH-type transcriptional regulator DmlR [Candidatus Celerinatantimonas neptuna]|nr:MAG: HTH-type transcriptional regulator DmlR [Candidatus Celerinatantimonas neptuna]
MGRKLMAIDYLICATPEYLKEYGMSQHPRDLKQHCCICLGEEPGDSVWKFRHKHQSVRVQVPGRYAANHTGVRLDTALHHVGIVSLPYFTARRAIEQGKLVQVLPQWLFKTKYCGGAWVLYPPTRYLPPKIRVLIDFLAKRLAQEPTLGSVDRVC